MVLRSYNLSIASDRTLRFPIELVAQYSGTGILINLPTCLTLFDAEMAADLFRRVRQLPFGDPKAEALRRSLGRNSDHLRIDKNRRMQLPEFMCDEARLRKRATLLAVGRRLRIVASEEWDTFRKNPSSDSARKLLIEMESPIIRFGPFESDNSARKGFKELETIMREAIEKAIRDQRSFERAVGEVLDSANLGLVEITQYSKDQGIDLIIHASKEDGIPINLYVQCKAGQKRATVHEIRELLGVVSRDGARAGLLVSVSGFTRDALNEAKVSQLKLGLVHAEKLARYVEDKVISDLIAPVK